MADDVLINFVGKTDQLQPAEDALESIIAKEGEVGTAWKKTSEVMAAGTKQSIDNTNKLAKSIDAMAVATKSMDKVIIGGAYKQYLKEIQAQLGLTSKELISYVQNARKAAQEAIFSAKNDQEIKELTLSIEAMNDQLALLGAEEEKTGTKTTSLRARLKEAKDELVALADAGITSGPAFDAARKKAGELDDQVRDLNQSIKGLGSDTKHIDGLISLASGVAGGFAVAQGAAALFGSENEEVQKALLKVNAAMAILQGLQQLQLVLQKESAASLLFNTTTRAANTAAIVTQTVAEGAQVVATEAATVATVELNTAMSLNPVGLVIIGILAAVAAFNIFSKDVETAAEKTERLTKESEDLYTALQKISKVNQYEIDRNVQIVKNKTIIDQLTAEGAGIEKINTLKKEQLRLETDNLKTELYNIKAAQSVAEDGTQFTERELAVKSKIYENDKAQLLLDIETNQVLQERALLSATGNAEAEIAKNKLIVLQNKIDSIESINAITTAEINAINARRREELNNIKLTAGERAKINAESNLAIEVLQRQQQKRLLDVQKADINSKLLLAQKGSEEEYNLKIQALEQQRKIELSNEELTLAEVNEIRNKYRVQEEELTRKFSEQKIQNEISYLNSYLDAFGLTEDRKLELTIRRLDRQRDLEISEAEGNAAKIKEINAKYDKQILESKKAQIKAEFDFKVRMLDAYNHEENAAAERTLSKDNSTLEEKKAASDKILKNDLDRIKAEEDALKASKTANVITEQEYSLQVQEIANKRADAEIAATERVTSATLTEVEKRISHLKTIFDFFGKGLTATIGSGIFTTIVSELENFAAKSMKVFADLKAGTIKTIDAIKEIAAAAVQAAQSVINQVFADASAQRQQILSDEISALEESKQKELNALNLTEQQKADIEDRYRQQERRLKIQAFNADKDAKKSQALINGALGATLALAEYPWPYSLIVAGIIAGLTGVEIAEINRQQPPRFKHGKVDIDGPGTPTSDSIPAFISVGESVINAKQTSKHKEALESINNDTFDKFLNNKFSEFVFPQMPDNVINFGGQEIDYGLLAREVAKEMKGIIPSPAQVHNIIDKDGLRSYIIDGSNQVEIKNKRYSME